MRSAIVHDWLISDVGGSEKVLETIHRLFPSPIYTLVYGKEKLSKSYFKDLDIRPSFIQKLPRSETKYKNYLPLFPLAIENFDLNEFDLVISSSHCAAKGAMTHLDQLHICYCHTPMRYAWDLMHEYLKEEGLERGIKGALVRFFLHYLRGWDVHSSRRVDHFVANSQYVARRIKKIYDRSAEVIYPPVDLTYFQIKESKDNYYVAASRFVSYKKVNLIVEAFSQMPDKKLIVIGDGPEWKKVQAKAGKNIELLGYQPDSILKQHLQNARGFVFAAKEDFGLLPVEAMACGTPVIAFGKGGVRETVADQETGLFFEQQSVGSIVEAIKRFDKSSFDPRKCRQRAEFFSQENFNRGFQSFVLGKYSEFMNR